MTLAIHRVTVALAGRTVLQDASLTLAPGAIVGIIGPNGAGKSTLLRTAAGLLAPRQGTVTLDGRPLADWERRAVGRAIAFLPQERTVDWPMRVDAVVALGRLPHRGPAGGMAEADREAVAMAMRATDIAHLAGRSVGAVSGGERARVLLARALAQDARFLLADEPTAGLDPAHQLAFFAHLGRLAGAGRSVAVALHDLGLAARFCTHLLLLHKGRCAAFGPPSEVLVPETLEACYGIRARVGDIDGVPVVLPIEIVT